MILNLMLILDNYCVKKVIVIPLMKLTSVLLVFSCHMIRTQQTYCRHYHVR